MDIFGDRKYGVICLCGFLALTAMFSLTNITVAYGAMVQGVLAGASAILLWMNK